MTAPQPKQEDPLQVPGAGTVCALHNGAILCQTPLYFLKRQLILKTKKLLESTYWLVLCSLLSISPESASRTQWLSAGLLLTKATPHKHELASFCKPWHCVEPRVNRDGGLGREVQKRGGPFLSTNPDTAPGWSHVREDACSERGWGCGAAS